jgi:2',3'-cyclic-nucleotide 2'-phosphodiesterase
MKILFIGDVVGKPGRDAVAALVPNLRRDRSLDLVIANGENSAHGAGLTSSTVKALLEAGVDVITAGDHTWDQRGFEQDIETIPQVIRPLNFSPSAPGRGATVVHVAGKTAVGVVNLIGRVFMPNCDCPFRAVQAEIAKLRRQTCILIVDFHAEATSEKIAMGRFLDGQVSAVIGTHTHVQTSDEQLLPKGTAYISDAGMCGPHDSVLGRDVGAVLKRFLTQMPQKLEVAAGKVELCGVIADIEEDSGQARSIERLRIPLVP